MPMFLFFVFRVVHRQLPCIEDNNEIIKMLMFNKGIFQTNMVTHFKTDKGVK